MLTFALQLLMATASAQLHVNVELHGDTRTGGGSVVAIPTGSASDPDKIRVPLGTGQGVAPKEVDLALSPGETFKGTCEGKSVWCPTIEANAPVVTLPIFPSGRLTGKFVVPPGHANPSHATIQGIVSGSARWRFSASVPVSLGVFSVPVPAVQID